MSVHKLLIVDDCQSIRLTVQRILSQAGYDVITAANGDEAIARLQEAPSLIVLDIEMPGTDGYGVCEKLRELGEDYAHLPVVFLTCLESKALELLGREFGAYLKKPVQPGELLAVVERQLAFVAR
jgi:DNA-binding response OmpR family regulator